MNFVAIDFETAHGLIPCEIGVCVVREGEVVESFSHLIKPSCFPYINYHNQNIHGITPEMVVDCDTFDSLWYNKLRDYIEKETIIAHNAGFDISVLKATLNFYDIKLPRFNYTCSYRIAKKVWRGFSSYSLGKLSAQLGIEFNHHRAGDDAYACAKVILKGAEESGVKSLAELAGLSGISIIPFPL